MTQRELWHAPWRCQESIRACCCQRNPDSYRQGKFHPWPLLKKKKTHKKMDPRRDPPPPSETRAVCAPVGASPNLFWACLVEGGVRTQRTRTLLASPEV
jgi:hypothetical protein